MRFTASIESGNAAFEEEPCVEVARILRRLAEEVEAHEQGVGAIVSAHGPLLDVNGNKVGAWVLTT